MKGGGFIAAEYTITAVIKSGMKKMLPLNLNVNVDVNCLDFFRLAAIMADDRFLPWFVERFICVYMNRDFDCHYYEVYGFNSLEYSILYDEVLEFELIIDKDNIVSRAIQAIDRGEFVTLRCDGFYVKGGRGYQTDHYIHAIVLCGYDEESKEFSFIKPNLNIPGWNIGAIGISDLKVAFYSALEFTRNEINNVHSDTPLIFNIYEPASTFFIKDKNFSRKPRLNIIYNSLRVCMHGGEYTDRHDESYLRRYGISIYKTYYDELIKMIPLGVSQSMSERFVPRGIRMLIESKRGLLFRLKYLHDQKMIHIDDILANNIEGLCGLLNGTLLLLAKYYYTFDEKLLEKAKHKFIEAEELDRDILKKASSLVYDAMKETI